MQSRLETLDSLHQSLEENLTKATEDHSELRAKYEMSLQQLQTDVEAISVALNESKANNTSTVESLKKQIRDLEQQVQSSGQDRVDLVVRQGQMQKFLEELLQSQDAMRQELELLKSQPLP